MIDLHIQSSSFLLKPIRVQVDRERQTLRPNSGAGNVKIMETRTRASPSLVGKSSYNFKTQFLESHIRVVFHT